MTQDDFQKMLVELMKKGLRITMFMKGETLWFDLNTGMKSHLHITYDKEKSVAEFRGRYAAEGEIHDYEDLILAVQACDHGRGFASVAWLDILRGL